MADHVIIGPGISTHVAGALPAAPQVRRWHHIVASTHPGSVFLAAKRLCA